MGQNEDRSPVPKSTAFSRPSSIESSLIPGAAPVKPVQPAIPVPSDMGYQPTKFEPPIMKATSPAKEEAAPAATSVAPATPSLGPVSNSTPVGFDAARWVADVLEGGEEFHEKNGDVTRYGIGDSGGYSKGLKANTAEEAASIILDRYASLPGIKEHFSQLSDPRDQAAVLQLALHRPGWLQNYFKKNPIAADRPFDRNALLGYQEEQYRQRGGPYLDGFLNRVARTRDYNPQVLAQVGGGS